MKVFNDRRLKATLFYGGCDGRISSGRANLAAGATVFRRLRIHLFITIGIIVALVLNVRLRLLRFEIRQPPEIIIFKPHKQAIWRL